MIIKPNLFTIGASKCGTTFLHHLLGQHPEICMSKIKEPWFFTCDDYQHKFEWYQSLFDHCGIMKYFGESSPTYSETTYFKDVAKRIFEFNQSSKVIYIVREPFSRLRSVYYQTWSTGHWAEKKFYHIKMPLEYREAVFNYPPFLEATKYWTHIQNYRRYFHDDQIKVLFFEDLISDPISVLSDIFQFLEVDVHIDVRVENVNKNQSSNKKSYNLFLARLRNTTPRCFRQLVPGNLKSKLSNLVAKPIPEISQLHSNDMKKIHDILSQEVEALYAYLDIQNDPWLFFDRPLTAFL